MTPSNLAALVAEMRDSGGFNSGRRYDWANRIESALAHELANASERLGGEAVAWRWKYAMPVPEGESPFPWNYCDAPVQDLSHFGTSTIRELLCASPPTPPPPAHKCSASTERVARAIYERVVYAGEPLAEVLADYDETSDKAAAWMAVVSVLNEVTGSCDWIVATPRGIDSAVLTIRRLAPVGDKT